MTEIKKYGIIQTYFDKSEIKLCSKYFVFNGKMEGEYKLYYDNNDQLSVMCNCKNDKKEGEYKLYHNNGWLLSMVNYKNNKKEGKYKQSYLNGKLYVIWNYKNGNLE